MAAHDPRVPWYAKAIFLLIAAYALSPIDLIPDFIPVIGYLDELVLLPLGILLTISLIPSDPMVEFRSAAATRAVRATSPMAGVVIILLWIGVATLARSAGLLMWRSVEPHPYSAS